MGDHYNTNYISEINNIKHHLILILSAFLWYAQNAELQAQMSEEP